MAGSEKTTDVSLNEVHRSVEIPRGPRFWKRLFAFVGPAYLVSVGYMDPGNWATDLEGGSRFGYQLLWVLLISNLMGVLLQNLCVRLGMVAGRDLAQACREYYPQPVGYCLWFLSELAIAATDLAEVLGTAIGLNLLFHIPLVVGAIITGFDAFLLLLIQRLGIRRMEGFILLLVGLIGLSFVVELFLARPVWGDVARGFVPWLTKDSLYVAMGILGATVMPHNLYLHSSLVQTRDVRRTYQSIRAAIRFNLIDSMVALNGAFFINASILILAGAVFYKSGKVVSSLAEAHELLSPLLGTHIAGIAFAVALLAAGQSSTLTGTLAGQIVMEGFLQIKVRPWLRRLITRLVAIVPAVLTLSLVGDEGGYHLLILSQVILSMQLPFAIIPLIWFTSSRKIMGEFVSPMWVKLAAGLAAGLITAMNVKLVMDITGRWIKTYGWLTLVIVPVLIFCAVLLIWLIVWPMVSRLKSRRAPLHTPASVVVSPAGKKFERVGVALELSEADKPVLEPALLISKLHSAVLVLMHVVGGVSGRVYGAQGFDMEVQDDEAYLESLVDRFQKDHGIRPEIAIGYNNAPRELVRLVEQYDLDLLIMGAHRHGTFMDILMGQTVSAVRHAVEIPVLVVPQTWADCMESRG